MARNKATGGSKLVQGGHTGKTNYALATGLALGAAAGIAWSARHGRRLISALVGFAAGLALTPFGVLSYVCLAYSGYLMFRHSQAQKKLNQLKPRRSGGPRPAGTRLSRRSSKATDGATPGPNARRPAANRRYTPPKAKTPRH